MAAARARGGCARCGGARRRQRGRRGEILLDCRICMDAVCERHSTWEPQDDGWICSRCLRDKAKQEVDE